MDNEIVETTCTDVVATPITDDTLISLAEQAERRIDAMTKIKKVSLKLTNRHDWTDQGGKPYLQVSGAEKIARMFGISWKISDPTLENQEGGHFGFTYKGFFSSRRIDRSHRHTVKQGRILQKVRLLREGHRRE